VGRRVEVIPMGSDRLRLGMGHLVQIESSPGPTALGGVIDEQDGSYTRRFHGESLHLSDSR